MPTHQRSPQARTWLTRAGPRPAGRGGTGLFQGGRAHLGMSAPGRARSPPWGRRGLTQCQGSLCLLGLPGWLSAGAGDSGQEASRAVVTPGTPTPPAAWRFLPGSSPPPTEGPSRAHAHRSQTHSRAHPPSSQVGTWSEMVSQNPPLTPIPKCLFLTKWPSPGPSLAGMGESACRLRGRARHQHGRARTHTHATRLNTRVHTMPACGHQACLRSQEFPEQWAQGHRQPSRGRAGGPRMVVPLFLGVRSAVKGSGAQNAHRGVRPAPAPPASSCRGAQGCAGWRGGWGDEGQARGGCRHHGAGQPTNCPQPTAGGGE